MSVSLNNEFIRTTLFDSAALSLGTWALSKTKALTWLNTPMTPQGLALCTGANALMIAAGNFGNTENEDVSHAYRLGMSVAMLVGNIAFLSFAAKPIAEHFAIVLNTYAVTLLAVFQAVVKTAASVYHSFIWGSKVKNIDDMKNLSPAPAEIGKYKAYFENNPNLWKELGFQKQVAFNALLEKNKLSFIAFTPIDPNTELKPEDLKAFQEFVGDTPTVEQAKILFNNNAPVPIKTGSDVFSKLDLDLVPAVIVPNLSKQQVIWYHKFFQAKTPNLSDDQFEAFAEAFYNHSLEQPSDKFTFVPIIPESEKMKDITAVQFAYIIGYYEKHLGFHLSPEEKVIVNKIKTLTKANEKVLLLEEPKAEELKNLPEKSLKALNRYYDANPDLWIAKSETRGYQEAFNSALEEHLLTKRELTPQPWSTTKKVAVFGTGILLGAGLLGAGLWWGTPYLAPLVGLGSNNAQPDVNPGEDNPPLDFPQKHSAAQDKAAGLINGTKNHLSHLYEYHFQSEFNKGMRSVQNLWQEVKQYGSDNPVDLCYSVAWPIIASLGTIFYERHIEKLQERIATLQEQLFTGYKRKLSRLGTRN